MTQALVPASHETVCGKCGGRLSCAACAVGDLLQLARQAISECIQGTGGRNAQARITAARYVMDKDYLANLTDEDLLAEVRRRAAARRTIDRK